MSRDKNKREIVIHVVRKLFGSIGASLAVCAALLASPSAHAVDSGDIVVVSSKGEVHITVSGVERKVRAGGVLELPASVRTGRDGNLELKQGATTVSVGPETLLDFPALEKRGAPIDRIVQPRGNVFYDIGKREGRKLRVETPYLVGVIKGTQFNVAAHESSTTISLFEGLLEVRAADDSDVVDLKAGEIASYKRGDKSIGILKMDAGKAPTNTRPATSNNSMNSVAPNPDAPRITPANDEDTTVAGRDPINVRTDVEVNADVRPESQIGTGVAANLNVADAVDAAASAGVSVSPSGADVVTSVGVDAGPVTTDLGTSTSVDLGAGVVDVAANTSVDAGAIATNVTTDAAIDLSAGTVDTGVVVGVSAPQVDVVVGVDASVDAAAGTINAGLDVGSTSIDVGVDVSATVDTVESVTESVTETVTETVTDTVTDTVVNTGGLLDALTRLPGRK